MFRRIALSLLLCLSVAACGDTDLRALRSIDMPDDPYFHELSRLYLTLSEAQARDYDWDSSEYFANKGLKAAYGHEVPRANPADWKIPASELPEVTRANALFDQIITPEARSKNPLFAAQAQVYFDCWLEQAEEATATKQKLRPCQEAFFDALGAIQQFDYYYKNTGEKGGTPLPREISPVISTSYLVFFGWNSASLGAEAMKVVATIIRDYKAHGKAEVVLNGHSDSTGSEDENLKFSQRRAEAVKAALIHAGIPSKLIQIFAFGESDPKVKTKDNTKEKSNRRVEVFLD